MKVIRNNELSTVTLLDDNYNILGIREAVFNQLKALTPEEIPKDDGGNYSIIVDILNNDEWKKIKSQSNKLVVQLNIKSYLPGNLVFAKDPFFNNHILYYIFQEKDHLRWSEK
jgi:hypothetical protein